MQDVTIDKQSGSGRADEYGAHGWLADIQKCGTIGIFKRRNIETKDDRVVERVSSCTVVPIQFTSQKEHIERAHLSGDQAVGKDEQNENCKEVDDFMCSPGKAAWTARRIYHK